MQEQNNQQEDQQQLLQQQQSLINEQNNNNDQQTQQQNALLQQNTIQEKLYDFWDLIIQGNFDIFYLYPNIIELDKLGPQGFGIVHYSATYGYLEALKLLKKIGANLDLLSSGQQTALSISCNYGFLEVSKFLIDNGCNINHINSVGMTPLSYAIKNKRYPLIFYLMIKIKNLNFSDNQGNSFLHYSAIENDIYMFRFYRAYQFEANLFDKQGQTPLTKAVNNCSIDVIKHMLRHNPELIDYALDFSIINSSIRIKQLIAQTKIKLKFSQNQTIQKFKHLLTQHLKIIRLVLMVLIIFFQLIFFVISEVQKTLNDGFFGLIIDISFILGLLYMIFYIVWFMLKTTDKQNQGIKLLQRKMNQLAEQNKVENNQPQTYIQISENDQQNSEKKSEKKQRKKNIVQQLQYNDDMLPTNLNGNKQQELIQINKEEEKEEEDDQDDEEAENENLIQSTQNNKINFIEKMKEENKKRISFYDIEMTPTFLEGITLKDFLSLNYKQVEEFIDEMKNKPNFYFKFATKISQYKEEINQLLEINDPLWYSGFTILHLLYFLFEQNRFRLIHRINWERICFSCLSYKLPRTLHCSKCDECVKDFHFHSNLLGKCINSTNHLFYFIFILSLTILVNSYLLFVFIHYYDQINSMFVILPNLYFLIDQNSRIQALIFIFNLWMSFILNFELIVEILCILFNMTQNEFFNSHRYKYLHTVIKQKNDKYYMTFIKRLKNGIGMNIFHFVRNSLRNIKLL